MSLEERVFAILLELAQGMGVRPGRLDKRLRLREDLGLDSVALVDLLVAVESRCGVRFDPLSADMERVFCTVGSLVRFVRERAQEGGVSQERRAVGGG